MADYSLVILVGRLTKDPELKYSASGGLPHTTLHVAVNRQLSQSDGSIKKTTSLVEATAWRHQAELVCQMTKKGSTLMIIGKLEQHRWTNKNGKSRGKLVVTVDRIQFLDQKISESLPVLGER
jgi:single-strand DNA-binding protein